MTQFSAPGASIGASAAGRIPPGVFALPFGVLILLAGLWGGLARLGYQLPAATTSLAQHGFLMSLGFLGTLISTERAVALRRSWAWSVPALSVLGSGWLVAGGVGWVGYGLMMMAGIVLVAVYGRLDRVQRSTHNTLMGLAAVGWVVAALLAMIGRPISVAVPWLAVFLVVTITAERLELSRMLKRSSPVRVSLVVAILAMVAGATVAIWLPDAGIRITGVAMVAMAMWLWVYDLARRTIRARGVTRFMAAGLLAGYVWLAGGGLLWAAAGFQVDNPLYDAEIHAILLGFVMSMVFAHAPVIAPAVIRRPLPYFPFFYAPLALLHLSLLLRVLGGDAAGSVRAWRLGGVLGEIAILGFVAVTAGAFVRAAVTERRRKAEILARLAARATDAADAPAAEREIPQPVASSTGAHPRSRASTVIGSVIGVAVLVGAVAFAHSGLTDTSSAADSLPASAAEVIDSATATAGVEVSLVDMRIEPSHLTVEPGSHLVLHVTNDGAMRHDLRVDDRGQTPLLDPGESATLDVGVVDGALDGWCTVPGHRAAGMTMSIAVAEVEGSGPSGMGHGPGMSSYPGTSDDAVSHDLSAAPGDGWQPYDASLPPASDSPVHEVTWHIKDVEMEVAPGVRQTMWTFGGTVPGPVLRGTVGDTFEVTVVNDTEMQHNLDFHAESGPPAKVMTPVPPGGRHTYRFTADHAGAWLYHCSVAPMLMHMGNGMYGALIVDPPDLPPAGVEYVLVGSELFFGPPGGPGDYAKMLADEPDAVVFNGYPFAYRHVPLSATTGELVRIWVVDAGPTRSLAFHVIGAQFTTEYLGGAYLLRDGRSVGVRSGAAQTLPVDPGNGGFVELTFDQPGSYPFLTHAMADAVIGGAGTVRVTAPQG